MQNLVKGPVTAVEVQVSDTLAFGFETEECLTERFEICGGSEIRL